MASHYSCVTPKPFPYKSNSSTQLYGSTPRNNNMGVLVTGPWPMSQPVSHSRHNSSVSSKCPPKERTSQDCRGCGISPHHVSRQDSISYSSRSQPNLRPLSMPPSFAMLSSDSCGANESSIELLPLNSRIHPPVPCRATITGEINPTSPPTCVPWLKKMKVIKRIQRKIGIG